MAVVEFVYSKEEAQGGQIHELKYKVETVGPKLRRCTLLDDREMRTGRGSFCRYGLDRLGGAALEAAPFSSRSRRWS